MMLFFHLLQSGLWNKKADPKLFKELPAEDWIRIYRLAVQQALIGIVYDGMCTLPVELQPERSLRLKWFMTVQRIEQSNHHLNTVLADFAQEMKMHHIDFVLLKGQGQASFYPNPMRRQSGDIDLYFPTSTDYRKACEWVAEQKIETAASVKHISFEWKGAQLEFHDGASELYYPVANRLVRKHAAQCQEESGAEVLLIHDAKINGLSPEANLIYMMLHVFSHLIGGGIGLRQFCDWANYAAHHRDNINRQRLDALLDKSGLRRFANAFADILVDYIGLDPADLPYHYERESFSQWLFFDIMEGGNFGSHHQYGVRPSGKWAGKWYTARKMITRASRFFYLSPTETLWLPLHYAFRNIQLLTTK